MRFTLASLLLLAAPIWAHHGSAGFDQNKPVHLVGKVSHTEWSNPHVVIHLDVTGVDGKVSTWMVNTRPPSPLIRSGYSKETFAVGTELTIDGFQAKDGSNHVNGTSIAFKDGKKITSPDCFADQSFCYHVPDGSSVTFSKEGQVVVVPAAK
jgi:hypothetical protein